MKNQWQRDFSLPFLFVSSSAVQLRFSPFSGAPHGSDWREGHCTDW